MEKRELKVTDDNIQNLLMQSIVERVEGMELLLHAALDQKQQVDYSAITSEIASFKKEILANFSKLLLDINMVKELNQNIAKLQQEISVHKEFKIEHKHVLHKGIWLFVGLTFLLLLFTVGWMRKYDKLNSYKEDSVKYRYLKAFGNESAIRLSHRIDSLYNVDSGNFWNMVVKEEKQLKLMTDSVRLTAPKSGKSKLKKRN